jgi:hypothetical protein
MENEARENLDLSGSLASPCAAPAKRGKFTPPRSSQVLDSIENPSPQTGQIHPVLDPFSSPFAQPSADQVFASHVQVFEVTQDRQRNVL